MSEREIDPSTGFPTLPEGEFIRISPWGTFVTLL
jgi:hypothetical protein